MIELLKELLVKKLSDELADYNTQLDELKGMEEKIRNDNSEKEYVEKTTQLKKIYRFKKKNAETKKEYEKEFNYIKDEYDKNLREFKIFYDEYRELKEKLAKWNIYKVKKQLESIPNYTKLKEFKLNYNEAFELLNGSGAYDNLTEEEKKEINELPKK